MQGMEASYLRGVSVSKWGIPMIPTEVKPRASSKGVVVSGRCCDILCRSMFEVFNIIHVVYFLPVFVEKDWKGASEMSEIQHVDLVTLRKAPGFAGLLILPVLGLGRKVFLCWVELQPFGCLSNCSATATWCCGDNRKFWWMILEEASKMIHLNDLWKGFLWVP